MLIIDNRYQSLSDEINRGKNLGKRIYFRRKWKENIFLWIFIRYFFICCDVNVEWDQVNFLQLFLRLLAFPRLYQYANFIQTTFFHCNVGFYCSPLSLMDFPRQIFYRIPPPSTSIEFYLSIFPFTVLYLCQRLKSHGYLCR